MSAHEVIKYLCKLCGYKASTKSHLRRQQLLVHEGVKHLCELCEYMASEKGSLTKKHSTQYMEE